MDRDDEEDGETEEREEKNSEEGMSGGSGKGKEGSAKGSRKAPPPTLEEAAEALEVYKGHLNQMASQAEILQNSLKEIDKALSTLTGLRENKEEAEILVPVGAGCFIYAKVIDVNTALIPIGRDIAARLPLEKGIAKLEERKKEVSELLDKTTKEVARLNKEVGQLQQYVEVLYRQQMSKDSHGDGGCSGCSSCSSNHIQRTDDE